MPRENEEPRYEVRIPCTAVKVEGDERRTMATLTLEYFDLSYADLVAINSELSKLVERLVGLGIANAEAKGQGKKLAALGITKAD